MGVCVGVGVDGGIGWEVHPARSMNPTIITRVNRICDRDDMRMHVESGRKRYWIFSIIVIGIHTFPVRIHWLILCYLLLLQGENFSSSLRTLPKTDLHLGCQRSRNTS